MIINSKQRVAEYFVRTRWLTTWQNLALFLMVILVPVHYFAHVFQLCGWNISCI